MEKNQTKHYLISLSLSRIIRNSKKNRFFFNFGVVKIFFSISKHVKTSTMHLQNSGLFPYLR